MVELIEMGNDPKNIVHKTSCHSCNSVLSYRESDASITKVSQNMRIGFYGTIVCPVCDNKITRYLRG